MRFSLFSAASIFASLVGMEATASANQLSQYANNDAFDPLSLGQQEGVMIVPFANVSSLNQKTVQPSNKMSHEKQMKELKAKEKGHLKKSDQQKTKDRVAKIQKEKAKKKKEAEKKAAKKRAACAKKNKKKTKKPKKSKKPCADVRAL